MTFDHKTVKDEIAGCRYNIETYGKDTGRNECFLFTYLPLISVLKNVCDSIAYLENGTITRIEEM
ncbi:MAG: hypothetical protein GQ576_02110 [Methanococcoides sp.]|nr:hypothetical protein [Methanococcoides sp.]